MPINLEEMRGETFLLSSPRFKRFFDSDSSNRAFKKIKNWCICCQSPDLHSTIIKYMWAPGKLYTDK